MTRPRLRASRTTTASRRGSIRPAKAGLRRPELRRRRKALSRRLCCGLTRYLPLPPRRQRPRQRLPPLPRAERLSRPPYGLRRRQKPPLQCRLPRRRHHRLPPQGRPHRQSPNSGRSKTRQQKPKARPMSRALACGPNLDQRHFSEVASSCGATSSRRASGSKNSPAAAIASAAAS